MMYMVFVRQWCLKIEFDCLISSVICRWFKEELSVLALAGIEHYWLLYFGSLIFECFSLWSTCCVVSRCEGC